MAPTAQACFLALQRMAPRSARIVQRVAIDGLDLEGLARIYGLDQPAAGILLMRAARELDLALADRPAPPLAFAEELESLPRFLESWRHGEATGPAGSLVAASAEAAELKARLIDEAARQAAHPRRRQEAWLRWGLIATILGLSAYWYRRDHPGPTPAPPATAPSPERLPPREGVH